MEHIAALLLIIGCSQDLGECRELPSPVTIYETTQECDQQLPGRLEALKGEDDRVFATCVFVDPAMEEMDAELVWDVTEAEGLVAAVEPFSDSDVLVASSTRASEGVAQ